MSRYEFYAYKNIIKLPHAIRTKQDLITILVNITDNIPLLSQKKQKEDISIVFAFDKLSRIFIYETSDKIHSFYFPFTLKYENNEFKVFYKTYFLDASILSAVKSFFYQINNK